MSGCMQVWKCCCCVLRRQWPGEEAEIQELHGAVGQNGSRRRQLIPVATLMSDLKGKAEAKDQKNQHRPTVPGAGEGGGLGPAVAGA